MAEPGILWKEALTELENHLPKPQLEAWVAPLRPLDLEGDTLVLGVSNELQKAYLAKHCQPKIEEALSRVASHSFRVRFDLTGEASSTPSSALQQSTPRKVRMLTPVEDAGLPLNPKYTFDTFVVGNSNRFAHAATQGVAESPGKSHNPLFLYGGVGLGKSHLLHAVGHFVKSRFPQKRVVFTTLERFTNDMIKAIRDQNMADFRRKYRLNVDLLLIDDIQFLQGKEATQEEFFHTFNDLHEAHHQIVLTSDAHPREVKLEDRLRSRFQGGLVADLQPPDTETRIAILKKKAEIDHLFIPEEVFTYIAEIAHSNIRELEGALNFVMARANQLGISPTLEFAREALHNLFPSQKQPQSFERIQAAVAKYFSLDSAALAERTRTDAIAYPRQIAMFLCREILGSSFEAIGMHFGGRDHTTALYAIEKIRRLLKDADSKTYFHMTEIRKVMGS